MLQLKWFKLLIPFFPPYNFWKTVLASACKILSQPGTQPIQVFLQIKQNKSLIPQTHESKLKGLIKDEAGISDNCSQDVVTENIRRYSISNGSV